MASWLDLPAELRDMILEVVAQAYSHKSEPGARVGYATVSREWQLFFEEETFRKLVVDQTQLVKLESLFGSKENQRRREYVKHLQLIVKLKECGCDACQPEEDSEITAE